MIVKNRAAERSPIFYFQKFFIIFCNELAKKWTNLLELKKGGPSLNIKKICEEFYPLVLGYLLTLTNGNRDLAEDLTQETFLRAIKNSNNFKGESK